MITRRRNKPTHYDTNLHIRVSAELYEKIMHYSNKKGITGSKFIRQALEDAIVREVSEEIAEETTDYFM
jgi:predicted DNA-binding protein